MNKPEGYDEAKTQGSFTPVELGGHYMVIKQVSEKQSSTGKDMIVVLFDFDDKDQQGGYFMGLYKNDIRSDKKYPNQATKYILVNDNDGKTSSAFKTFTTCVEHSNTGFTTQFGIKDWGKQFSGKKIGGIFGEEMDYYNGDEKKKRVLRWFCSTDKVEGAEIPNMSETKAYKEYKASQPQPDANGFINIPDGIGEELPFN